MRYFITKKVLVGIIILLCAIIFAMFAMGCGGSVAGLRPPGQPCPVASAPAGVLSNVAIWATWAAAVGLLACGVAMVFLPNKARVGQAAVGCLAILLIAGILHWIAAHWALLMLLCLIVLLCCGGAYAYLNRKALEKKSGIDLNRDGKIG